MSLNKGILLKGIFNPELLNDPLASYFFINLDFLLLHTAHFDKIITLFLFLFLTEGCIFSVFFFTLDNILF